MTDVVWAEDSASDLFLIRSILAEEAPALRVRFAEDGQQALDLVGRAPPAFLVLDLKMPRVDGAQALRRLAGRLPADRVLVFSSSGQPSEVDAVRSLGAGGFMQKPIDFPSFRAAVVAIARQAGAAVSRPPGPAAAVHHVLFWDSEATLRETALRFLRQGQQAGHGVVALATPERQRFLRSGLQGDDVVWIDAEAAAERCPADPVSAAAWFGAMFAEACAQASHHGTRPVSCFGEVVALLQARGDARAAQAIEGLGQDAAARQAGRLAILCAYPVGLPAEAREAACALHTTTLP